MLTIVEDGVLVVGDDPLLQLVHSPLFIDVDAFRDLVGRGEETQGMEDSHIPSLCARCYSGCGEHLWAWVGVSENLYPAI